MNRRSWAALFVTTSLIVLGASLHLLHLTRPSAGARVPPGNHVWKEQGAPIETFVERPNGLRDGDLVVAVGGQSMTSWVGRLTQPAQWGSELTNGPELDYEVLRGDQRLTLAVELGRYPWRQALRREWKAVLAEVSFLLLSVYVFVRRPREEAAQALLLASGGILSASTWSFGLQVLDVVRGWEFWLFMLTTAGGYMLLWAAFLHFMLVFPSHHPILKGRSWLIPCSYALPNVVIAVGLFAGWNASSADPRLLSLAGEIVSYLEPIYLSLAVIAAITNYRAATDLTSRTKTRWVIAAFLITGVIALSFGMIPTLVIGRPLIWWNDLALIGLLMPTAIAVAILQHQLFDIDRLYNRALVYGLLSILVVTLYVVLVGGLGTLLGREGDVLLSLGTTALVALLFEPLRARLQSAVNRTMYGDRNDPYSVLTRLGKDLGTTLTPQAVLPTISHTIADALKLPYVGIFLRAQEGYREASNFGLPSGDPRKLPLSYQGEQIGYLAVGRRAGDEGFSSDELKLLEDVCQQAGVAAHAVMLTDELQRSRERLVLAREEERRRLRRDLHDRLGASMASLALKLEAASGLVGGQPERARSMLADLQLEARDAIDEVRRLVHDLRPPALDELGLVAALESRAAQLARANDELMIQVEAPAGGLPHLPAAVEAAAYHICQEAMTNVIRHAGASSCLVELSIAGSEEPELRLRVLDDGKGIDGNSGGGVGLSSMRERAEELGGRLRVRGRSMAGTEIVAVLPLNAAWIPEEAVA